MCVLCGSEKARGDRPGTTIPTCTICWTEVWCVHVGSHASCGWCVTHTQPARRCFIIPPPPEGHQIIAVPRGTLPPGVSLPNPALEGL
jgi:hypothetical protein